MRFSFTDLLVDRRPATRGARMLCVILLILMFAVTLGECVELILLPHHVFRWLSILAIVDGGGLFLLELNERGSTRLASKLLVGALAVMITICAVTGGGMNTPAATYYLTVVFIAGLLLGRRWAILTAAACCVGGLVMVLSAHSSNLPDSEIRNNAFALWMGTVLNMSIIIGLQYFASRTARNALDQVRALSARLVTLREEERTRIAREVHDHLGQLLTAMKMEVHSAQTGLSGISDTDLRERLTAKLVTTTVLTDDLIQSVQKIASELRPGVLDCLGLEAAIESEAETFEERTGVRCQCNVPQTQIVMPDKYSTALFRIFQEILTNVARHAKASLVLISLIHEDGALMLDVEDNGVGLDESRIAAPDSLGLLGMQERAEALGGQIQFRRNRKGGTAVSVQIPLAGSTVAEPAAELDEASLLHPAFLKTEDSKSVA